MANNSDTNKLPKGALNQQTLTDLQNSISEAINRSENVAELKALYKFEKAIAEVLPFVSAQIKSPENLQTQESGISGDDTNNTVFLSDNKEDADFQPRVGKRKNPNPKAQPSKGY